LESWRWAVLLVGMIALGVVTFVAMIGFVAFCEWV
jgi:hypothetical protein